jgi:LmbE family N-acetylglucosaminyl deacetylase
MKTILVMTPHPDDAEIGAGGTIAKLISQGYGAYFVVCTNGNKGSSDEEMTAQRLASMRRREQLAAAESLGVKEVTFLDHGDGELEDGPELRGEIVRAIRWVKPEIVMTTDMYRRYRQHRDHRVIGRVVLDAVFPCAAFRLNYPEHEGEGLGAHRVRRILFWGSETPNEFVDITQTFDAKADALACHKSQLPGLISGGTRRRLEERAREVGRECGYPLAESFYKVEIPDSAWSEGSELL